MNIHHIISVLGLVLLLISGPVSAYYLSLDAPAQVKVGEPIVVSGSTNTPPPDKIDIVFSHALNVPIEIERQSIAITEKGETTFNVTFKTDGLLKGNYKVEGLSQSQRDFSAGSRSIRVIKLVDRSDMVTLTSPTWQEFEKTLLIEAKISGYTENAIQMEVKRENKTIFGPESIPVSGGRIKYELPIDEPGTYEISFADYEGFIGKYSIVSEEKDRNHLTGSMEEATSDGSQPSAGEYEKEGPKTPSSTSTQAPKKTENITGVTAYAEVSRDNPAFFVISTNTTPLTIQARGKTDLVLEYKTSATDPSVKVNDELGTAPETVTITDSVSEVYLKVYPYSYKAVDNVTITGDKASSVTLSDSAAKAFGLPPRYGSAQGQKEKETPIPVFLILVGLIIGFALFNKKK